MLSNGESVKVGAQELVDQVRHPGHLDEAREERPESQHHHRPAHRPFPLGDVMVGAGEPDVRVLRLAAQRVLRLGVGEVALLELARLLARLAPHHPEDDPERVHRGQEGGQVSDVGEDPVEAAALGGEDEDLVLREEPGCPGEGGERQGADDQQGGGERHGAAKAAHAIDVLGSRHRRDHRAGRHEQERLEEGVGHEMKEPGPVGADRDADDHVADLADGRVGDDPLQVGDRERHGGREDQRPQADEGGDVGRRGGEHEQDVGSGDQVDAGGDHGRGVNQRRDGGGALHGVGQPGVKRELGGLGERADAEQQADRHDHSLVGREVLRRRLEDRQVVEGAELAEDEKGREHEADVADHVDHERLHPGLGRRVPPVPEADQRVGREADERPADDQQDEVARQDQQQHREDEKVEVREVARVASVGVQVGDRVEVDQGRDPGDHADHVDGQGVDQDPDLDVEARSGGVGPQRRGQLPALGRLVEQHHQGADRAWNARPIAAVPIHPAARPRNTRQPNAFTRQPASGKASTSHP